MELVTGVSLHEMITRRGPTGPEAALAVLKGSLLGLAAAHALGIVHRDYKPDNVLVDGTGASKLTDFGIAARTGQAASGGTPLYMAPEQWAGAPASPASDIYAATAVFFECLTGRRRSPGRWPGWPPSMSTPPSRWRALTSGCARWSRGGWRRTRRPGRRTRPQFVAELEATAAAAYGAGWEAAGRAQLAAQAAALLVLVQGTAAAGAAPARLAPPRRRPG